MTFGDHGLRLEPKLGEGSGEPLGAGDDILIVRRVRTDGGNAKNVAESLDRRIEFSFDRLEDLVDPGVWLMGHLGESTRGRRIPR